MGTRDIDIRDLQQAYNNARSPKEREAIMHAGQVIRSESSKVSSMREALIKARRNGDTREVRDINEFVKSHKDYQNER